MTFALKLSTTSETKRVVDLIHYMNGCVRKKFTAPLILITDECRGDDYRVYLCKFIDKFYMLNFLDSCFIKLQGSYNKIY